MSDRDNAVIREWLTAHASDPMLRVIELGVYRGEWARELRDLFGERLHYHGVDNGTEPGCDLDLGDWATLHRCDTLDAVLSTPPEIDLLLIDACHCERHARLDFQLYAPKVRRGGAVVFHDTAPTRQGMEIAEYKCAWGHNVLGVGAAIQNLRLDRHPDWRLIAHHDGLYGVQVYERN